MAGHAIDSPTGRNSHRLVRKQFRDPAIELVHEKKMGELRMTGPRLPLLQADGMRSQAGQSTR